MEPEHKSTGPGKWPIINENMLLAQLMLTQSNLCAADPSIVSVSSFVLIQQAIANFDPDPAKRWCWARNLHFLIRRPSKCWTRPPFCLLMQPSCLSVDLFFCVVDLAKYTSWLDLPFWLIYFIDPTRNRMCWVNLVLIHWHCWSNSTFLILKPPAILSDLSSWFNLHIWPL